MCSAANRENSEEAPFLEPKADEKFFYFRELRIAALIHASNHVEGDFPGIYHHFDGGRGFFERSLVSAHPIVSFPDAIQADSHGPEATLEKIFVALGS